MVVVVCFHDILPFCPGWFNFVEGDAWRLEGVSALSDVLLLGEGQEIAPLCRGPIPTERSLSIIPEKRPSFLEWSDVFSLGEASRKASLCRGAKGSFIRRADSRKLEGVLPWNDALLLGEGWEIAPLCWGSIPTERSLSAIRRKLPSFPVWNGVFPVDEAFQYPSFWKGSVPTWGWLPPPWRKLPSFPVWGVLLSLTPFPCEGPEYVSLLLGLSPKAEVRSPVASLPSRPCVDFPSRGSFSRVDSLALAAIAVSETWELFPLGWYSNFFPLLRSSRKCTNASSWIALCFWFQEKIKLFVPSISSSLNCEDIFLFAHLEMNAESSSSSSL